MSATAALSAGAIAELATQGSTDFASLTVALAIATGIIAALAGLLRPGFLASFISEPVLKGFIVGLALTIIVGQLPQIFGVEKGSGDFFEKLWDLVSKLGDTSGTTLAVGLVSFGIVAGLRRIAPVVPGSLVAVAFGIAAVKLFDLSSHGVSIVGDSRAGSRPSGCPTSRRGATSTSRGAGSGSFSSGSRRAWAPPRRMRRSTTTRRPERRALGPRSRQSRLRAVGRHGRERQPLEDGGQRRRRRVHPAFRTGCGRLTVVTLPFLTGLFESLPEATLGAVVIAR